MGSYGGALIKGNDEGSSIDVKGGRWKSRADSVHGRPELKQCGRQKRGGGFKRAAAGTVNMSLSIGMRTRKASVEKMLEALTALGLTEVEVLLENVGESHLADEGTGMYRDLRGARDTALGASGLQVKP